MNFNSKIINLRKSFLRFSENIKKVKLLDLWKIYQRFMRRLPDIIHLKNIVLFSLLGSLIIFIMFSRRFVGLEQYLPKEPVSGGTYTEGIIGKIEQLNPLFSATNSAEDTAVTLIFSGLTKKDNNRDVVPDLAEKWSVSSDGKTYKFTLRENIYWQDGQRLTVDDVIFTIEAIQNPDTKSPLLAIWKGVTVKKIDDRTISFVLGTPYIGFLANTNFSILPKHLLSEIPARSLVSSEFGLAPVGSGPYAFSQIKNIKDSQELTLVPNENYYGQKPFIEKVVLKTYANSNDLDEAYSRREVLGMEKVASSVLGEKKPLPNIQNYNLSIPEYDAVYFNLRSEVMKEKSLREAISLAISRDQIIKDVYHGEALPIYTPLVAGYLGYNTKLNYKRSVDLAKAKLTEGGFAVGSDGFLAKGEKKASVRLVVVNESEKIKIAEVIQKNLKEIGIQVEIEKYYLNSYVQDHVRPRDFDLLLTSQNLGATSDVYAFWHSSGVNNPGLNFSGLNDRRLDKFLEQGRTMSLTDKSAVNAKYLEVTQVIAESQSAVYLTWPKYIYGVSKEVKGPEAGRYIEPKNRFWNIENWYIFDKKATVI